MSQRDEILAGLRRGPMTTAQLAAMFIPRYGGRLEELRKRGCVIETKRVSSSSFLYTLVSEPRLERESSVPCGRPRSLGAVVSPVPPTERQPQAPSLTLFEVEHTPAGAYDDLAA